MNSCEDNGKPLLTGDIFTILHLLEDQPADWHLTARSGNYKLTVTWRQPRGEEQSKLVTQKKTRKMSEARRKRNQQRMKEFKAKKAETAKAAQLTDERTLYNYNN